TIQLRKHIGSGSACVQDVHRGCALPENDSGCAPTARLSAESSDIYSRSTPPSNFEIGSSLCRLGLLVDSRKPLESETMTTWEWIVLIVIGALLFEFVVKREFVRHNERVWKLEKPVKQLEDRKD